jgi:hypothetical protein
MLKKLDLIFYLVGFIARLNFFALGYFLYFVETHNLCIVHEYEDAPIPIDELPRNMWLLPGNCWNFSTLFSAVMKTLFMIIEYACTFQLWSWWSETRDKVTLHSIVRHHRGSDGRSFKQEFNISSNRLLNERVCLGSLNWMLDRNHCAFQKMCKLQ